MTTSRVLALNCLVLSALLAIADAAMEGGAAMAASAIPGEPAPSEVVDEAEEELFEAASPAAAPVESFTPRCRFPVGDRDVRDPEFDSTELLATWQESPVLNPDDTVVEHGRLFVVPVDDDTGDFLMDQLVDIDGARPARLFNMVNGPEFAKRSGLTELHYTTYTDDESTVRLARVARNQTNDWEVQPLSMGEGKAGPNPTLSPPTATPLVLYRNFAGDLREGNGLTLGSYGWRVDSERFRDIEIENDGVGHWIPNTGYLVHACDVENEFRVCIYDTRSRSDRVVIRSTWEHRNVYGWFAPELGGQPVGQRALVISATVRKLERNRVDVHVYRFEPDRPVLWNLIRSYDPELPVITSPEPFLLDGKSYLSMQSQEWGTGPRTFLPGQIWIASVDPDPIDGVVVRRVISEDLYPEVSVKTEPESMFIRGGRKVIIYYQERGRLTVPADPTLLISCDTGLG